MIFPIKNPERNVNIDNVPFVKMKQQRKLEMLNAYW